MSVFNRWRSPGKRAASEINESLAEEYLGERAPRKIRYAIYGALILLLLLVLLGWFWSSEPAQFDIRTEAREMAPQRPGVVGVATLAATVKIVDALLDKPGGYLSNDIMPPGVWRAGAGARHQQGVARII